MEALANWLWQGCAVTVAATVVLHVVPRTTATARYRLWWVTLALVLAMPLATQLPGLPWPPSVAVGDALSDAALGFRSRTETGWMTLVIPPLPSWTVVVVLAIWASWVSMSAARVAGGLVALQRAKRSSRPFPADLEARLPVWRAIRASGRSTKLVVSNNVRAAAVLGLRDPAVAVAPDVLRELTPDEIDQVLVHEWAHVQRRDDFGRLVQVVVTTIAGLHPAVWWIDRRLHLERETACDDWTVNITGSHKRYAECLAKLASLAGRRDAVLIPAVLSSSTFTTRIVRLLDRRRNTSTEPRLPSLAVMSTFLVATALIAAGFELVVSRPVASEAVSAARADASMPISRVTSRASAAAPPDSGGTLAGKPVVRPKALSQAPAPEPTRQSSATHAKGLRRDLADAESEGGASDGTSHPEAPSIAPMATLADTSTTVAVGSPPTVDTTMLEPVNSFAPWRIAADAGVSVGRGSQKAAVATAGFFSRVGKSIARRGHSIVTVTGDSHH